MPKEDTQFKAGNPGRRKGSKNRRVKEAAEFAQSFLADPEYQESVRQRIIKGEQWLEELVFHYAYGKPMERSESTQDITQHGTVTEVVDFRNVVFDHGEQRNGHQSPI